MLLVCQLLCRVSRVRVSFINHYSNNAPPPICREHIKRRACSYFLNAEKNAVVASSQVTDIEDLAKLGKRDGLCPYYSMRYQAENADLVLLPYNYLLDPASRRGLNVGGGLICLGCIIRNG